MYSWKEHLLFLARTSPPPLFPLINDKYDSSLCFERLHEEIVLPVVIVRMCINCHLLAVFLFMQLFVSRQRPRRHGIYLYFFICGFYHLAVHSLLCGSTDTVCFYAVDFYGWLCRLPRPQGLAALWLWSCVWRKGTGSRVGTKLECFISTDQVIDCRQTVTTMCHLSLEMNSYLTSNSFLFVCLSLKCLNVKFIINSVVCLYAFAIAGINWNHTMLHFFTMFTLRYIKRSYV